MSDFSSVSPNYHITAMPAFIIGGGSSFQTTREWLKPFKEDGFTIGVNNSYTSFSCDFGFSLDHVWIKNKAHELSFQKRNNLYVAVSPTWQFSRYPKADGAKYLKRIRNIVMSENPEEVTGLNSGYGAINLAYLMGFKEIFLFGFDMAPTPHWHGGYSWHSPVKAQSYVSWKEELLWGEEYLRKKGVSIYNVSPFSIGKCGISESERLSEIITRKNQA